MGQGEDSRKLIYENVPVPAITVYLNNSLHNQQVGTLLVTTGEDGVEVSIDGKQQRAATGVVNCEYPIWRRNSMS